MKYCKACEQGYQLDSDHWLQEPYKTKQGEPRIIYRCRQSRNKENLRRYEAKREERLASMHKYQEENKEYLLAQKKAYYLQNRDEIRAKRREYYKENTAKALASIQEARKKSDYHTRKNQSDMYRRLFDTQYKLSCNLRSRLGAAMSTYLNDRTVSAVRDLGCTIEELVSHLQARFQEDMTWENYGEWHIDHIIPLSSFDLEDIEQAKLACHYSNLQPLWAIDNLRKNNKVLS